MTTDDLIFNVTFYSSGVIQSLRNWVVLLFTTPIYNEIANISLLTLYHIILVRLLSSVCLSSVVPLDVVMITL